MLIIHVVITYIQTPRACIINSQYATIQVLVGNLSLVCELHLAMFYVCMSAVIQPLVDPFKITDLHCLLSLFGITAMAYKAYLLIAGQIYSVCEFLKMKGYGIDALFADVQGTKRSDCVFTRLNHKWGVLGKPLMRISECQKFTPQGKN